MHETPGNRARQQGSMLLYLVIALAVLGAISVAATGFFSSSQQAVVRTNCPTLARHMAEAGMRYAASQLRAQADLATLTAMASQLDTTTYTVTDAGTFDLTVSAPVDNGTNYEVTVSCTGSACAGNDATTTTLGSVTFGTNVASPTPPPSNNEDSDISFDEGEGIGGFDDAGQGGDTSDAVSTNEEDNTASLGNGAYRSYGCLWYTGSEAVCTNGECDFGSGFRAYFDAMFSPNANGDGFVFTIINADNNTVNDCGGDEDMGELLAYGGPGLSGNGIRAPKIGLEFDIYSNTGTGNLCNAGNRGDDNASRDHAAWLLWGHDYWQNGCMGAYDDNRHGAGIWSTSQPIPPSADIPTNPENIGESGAGDDGYYYDEANGGDWMREYNSANNDKKFRIRVEVDRALTPNANGNYCYTLKGWIVRDDVDMPDGYTNVNQDYTDQEDETTWPQIVHTVVLSPTMHNKFDEMIFGWTVATGGATQLVTISGFKLSFKDNETTCPTEEKPQDYVFHVPMFEGQSGNMRNTVTGANSWSDAAYWLAGKDCPECSSRYFDDDHDPAPFWGNPASAMTTEGTVSAWVYLKDYKDFAGIIFNGTVQETFSLQFTERRLREDGTTWRFNEDRHTGPWYRIDDGDEKPMFCVTSGGVSTCVDSKQQLELDRWYHLAATFDSATDEMQFFIDGTRTAYFKPTDTDPAWDLPAVPISPPWDNVLLIGGQDTAGNYNFQGMIDAVYLYDRVLTNDEITALYNDGFKSPQE